MAQKVPFKLYSYCNSSASWRVRTVLNLKNLKYEIIPVNLLKGDQVSSDYEKLNPNKAVPTFIDENNNKLIESTAIIEYLEELYPKINLLPKEALEKAKVRAFCEIVNSFMQPVQNLRMIQRLEKEFSVDKLQWINPWFDHGFKSLETMINEQNVQGKYCFGDNVTLADVYLYPQVLGAMRRFNYSFENYPKVLGVVENLKQIKEFQDAEPRNQPDFPKQ